MYGMTHQKALKTGIIAAILLVAAILTTTTTTATNAQATGYQQGRVTHNLELMTIHVHLDYQMMRQHVHYIRQIMHVDI